MKPSVDEEIIESINEGIKLKSVLCKVCKASINTESELAEMR
jgi:hypothetical protein